MAFQQLAEVDFGSDYSTFRADGSYGLTYQRITGPRVPLEGVARRWLTNPGGIAIDGSMWWEPNAGFNVGRLLNASANRNKLTTYRSFLVREARRVDFVVDASVQLSYDGSTLSVFGLITLADNTTHPLLVGASSAAQVLTQFPSSPLA